MTEPRFAVLRAHPDLPAGFVPPGLDGLWIEVPDVPELDEPDSLKEVPVESDVTAVAVRTDRFERRGDGAMARVYEFRP